MEEWIHALQNVSNANFFQSSVVLSVQENEVYNCPHKLFVLIRSFIESYVILTER